MVCYSLPKNRRSRQNDADRYLSLYQISRLLHDAGCLSSLAYVEGRRLGRNDNEVTLAGSIEHSLVS